MNQNDVSMKNFQHLCYSFPTFTPQDFLNYNMNILYHITNVATFSFCSIVSFHVLHIQMLVKKSSVVLLIEITIFNKEFKFSG